MAALTLVSVFIWVFALVFSFACALVGFNQNPTERFGLQVVRDLIFLVATLSISLTYITAYTLRRYFDSMPAKTDSISETNTGKGSAAPELSLDVLKEFKTDENLGN